MGFRRFIFRGVTKVRDEWDPPTPPWTSAGCGRAASPRP